MSATDGYDNIFLAEQNGILEREIPPSRNPSLRVKSTGISSEMSKEAIEQQILSKLSEFFGNNDANIGCKSGFFEFMQKLSESSLGNVEKIALGQLIFASVLIVTSIALSITGTSLTSSLFFAGLLTVVQLLPAIFLWLLESPHVEFTFRLSSQICAFSNTLLASVSSMLESVHSSRVILLLLVACVQFGSLCLIKCYDHTDYYQRKQKKRAGSSSKTGGARDMPKTKKANMMKLQKIEAAATGRLRSPPPEKPEHDQMKIVR